MERNTYTTPTSISLQRYPYQQTVLLGIMGYTHMKFSKHDTLYICLKYTQLQKIRLASYTIPGGALVILHSVNKIIINHASKKDLQDNAHRT